MKKQKERTDRTTDLVLAQYLMRWKHVTTSDVRSDGAVTYMFYHGKKVLKGVPFRMKFSEKFDYTFKEWSPTVNLTHAMEIVVRLQKRFSNFSLHCANGWGAAFWNIGKNGDSVNYVDGFGETPAEAISAMAVNFLAMTKLNTKGK